MSEIPNTIEIEPTALRARLLGVEPPNVERLEQLKREVETVYFEELNPSRRAAWTAALALSLTGVAAGAYVATHINAPESAASPRLLRAIWTIFTLSMIASAYGCGRVLWAGKVNLRKRPRGARISLLVSSAIAVLLVVQAVTHPTIPMLAWAVFGLIWVVVSAANRVISRVELSELATREAMLRLELRLAEGNAAR